jgi:thiol-disulfide isomerase/thioredoxin
MPKPVYRAFVIILGVLSLLSACGPVPDSEPAAIAASSEQATVPGIHWFEGDVDAACAAAKAANKPVFLYWGAIWCPPCQEIKHTVFTTQQFIAQSELFVPVYLDGDTAQAQAAGEKFGVKGYPTMIVFNPAGEEITRIPGGIDISRYNSILALSLNELRATSMLVQLGLQHPQQLQAADFQQLAYYSWGQDFDALPAGTSPELFARLAEQSRPFDAEASARLYMQYLLMLADADSDGAAALPKPDPAQLQEILASPQLTLACWDYLAYSAPQISAVFKLDPVALASLHSDWQEALLAARSNPALTTAEQLAGWYPYLEFYFAAEPAPAALPADRVSQIRADAARADKVTRNVFARQSVVSQLSGLLQTGRLNDDARQLLLAELPKSAAPYYFMSGLAAMAEEEGDKLQALAWSRKAYVAAEGAATRFQWGAGYVRAMIRLQPQARADIITAALALVDEVQALDGIFAGRNYRVLRRLDKTLRQWAQEQNGIVDLSAFDRRLVQLCGEQAAGVTSKSNCEQLLADAAGEARKG